ncbi:MAG: metallophosphoesterase family protein [Desulfocapsaceae bacterium]|nr:metallophosphoesterase family protein [Desulfocapsaceae bacterium]
MKILLVSDIHANFPALAAVERYFEGEVFDAVINAGDSTVYGPFPNETINWLRARQSLSILGNTDKKVLKLLAGKPLKKPSKHEKRIMYTWTAEQMLAENAIYLRSLPTSILLDPDGNPALKIGVFHGSPLDDDEFLFPETSAERLSELAAQTPARIIITGHSHSPFHRTAGTTHFINPGSVGRMFDNDPSASCAVLALTAETIRIRHFRIAYPVQEVVDGLKKNLLPEIYGRMFVLGRKLN